MLIYFNDHLLEQLHKEGLLKRSPRPNSPQENFELADGLSEQQVRQIVKMLCDQLQHLYQVNKELYAQIPYDGPPME